MIEKITRIITLFILVLLSVFTSQISFAQTTPTETPPPTPDQAQTDDLNNKIKELEKKVADIKSEEKTLSSQISVMDSQIKLTEYRIQATEDQLATLEQDIDSADKKIDNLEGSLDNITKTLMDRISATYQLGTVQPLEMLLSSRSFTDFVNRANYVKIVQEHDKKLMYNTVQAKNDYVNQKEIFEEKKTKIVALKTQLENYTAELDNQKKEKQKLLAETQGSEANYQKLLNQARAQLAGFSRFTASQGGSSLLGSQTSCDDWGCYYNQRDSSWGGNALNGTQYSLASDGCLVTSVAMVYTHYGHRSVTPATINGISSNFASYYPAYLNKSVVADGRSSSRISVSLDSELSEGNPVIVGISYDGGPIADHCVVIISGSNGAYQMNDPYIPNGKNISFNSHYSVASIRSTEKLVL